MWMHRYQYVDAQVHQVHGGTGWTKGQSFLKLPKIYATWLKYMGARVPRGRTQPTQSHFLPELPYPNVRYQYMGTRVHEHMGAQVHRYMGAQCARVPWGCTMTEIQ